MARTMILWGMNNFKRISFGLRRNVLLITGVLLSVYFSYHLAYGVRSFSSLENLESMVVIKQKSLDSVQQQREKLEARVTLMRPETLSSDMLEEQVRYTLAFQKPDEKVIVGN